MKNKTKELTMNKLTKLGVSALCGTLAAVSSASAGEMTVTGGATATYASHDYGNTGNPLGMNTGLTFTGSGELDNGGTFTLSIGQTDQIGYDASSISYVSPSMGTFTYDEGAGTGLDRIDDMIPTAWEETNGTSVGTGMTTVAGAGGSTDIEWTAPSSMLADGMSLYFAYSPLPDGTKNIDKATGGDQGSSVTGSGWDLVVTHSGMMDGLNVFAGISEIDQKQATGSKSGNRHQMAYGLTYALGNVTAGYEYSKDDLNNQGAASTVSYYENQMYGISFAVNDDLSISYGIAKSEQHNSSTVKTELDASSLQIAYSMGGASIKLANTSVDHGLYDSSSATDRQGTTLAVSLAF